MAGKAMQTTEQLSLSDFDYELPPRLIAQHPLPDRAASRLLQVTATGLRDLLFAEVEHLLVPGDLLGLNDTRVIAARLLGHKESGGKVEVLIERILSPTMALAMVRTSHSPRPGTRFAFGDARATVEGRAGEFFVLRFDAPVERELERHGQVPLPPYIAHAPGANDIERYQTVYASCPGAVAAPTAGLHFTAALLDRLRSRGVATVTLTLHVGAGTFQPVRVEHLADHRMHQEHYEIAPATAAAVNAARGEGRRVVAVGTTSLRALESAAGSDGVCSGSRETSLFITPGYEFRVVDALITNFHLPRSSLLMLVCAFAGMERIRSAYAHAIKQDYRFFSYGDAMWLARTP
jgi:S-adenosylmethionine:tRNA ribosyltransferase-isomerase